MPSVVICDDHRVFGDALSTVLGSQGFEVLACTTEPGAGSAAVAQHQPDLYVVDLHFPGSSGLSGLGKLPAVSPTTHTVVLSASADPGAADDARRAGARGFVTKDRPLDEILAAFDDVVAGRTVFHQPAPPTRPPLPVVAGPADSPMRSLTSREIEVVERLVEGQDTVTLARELGVTYSTARTHIHNVLTKLGAHSKLEAVALFGGNGG